MKNKMKLSVNIDECYKETLRNAGIETLFKIITNKNIHTGPAVSKLWRLKNIYIKLNNNKNNNRC